METSVVVVESSVRREARTLPRSSEKSTSGRRRGRSCAAEALERKITFPASWTTYRRRDMIKVSVMYPTTPGARFDHDYYRDKHMPLVKARMGDRCKYYTVDKGLAGGAPGTPPTYVGMCHIFCDSVEAFEQGFTPHAKEILGDIPNYTDLSPVIQISEVVVG
jgi:uncharacterized protein (TIGR02118 family)